MKSYIKLKLLFALFTLFTLNAVAQEQDSLLKANQLKVGFKLLGPSLTYERKLSKYYTFYSELSVEYARGKEIFLQYTPNKVGSYDVDFIEKNYYYVFPQISLEGRRYYHFSKRQQKKKNISNNSSNFFSLGGSFASNPIFKTQESTMGKILTVAGKWGIQRVVAKKFSLELDLGAGYQYWSVNHKWYVTPVANLKFGYVIK